MSTQKINSIWIAIAVAFSRLLCKIPNWALIEPLTIIVRCGYRWYPRMRVPALRNLEICFPEQSKEWKEDLLRRNSRELAFLIINALRLPGRSNSWFLENIREDIEESDLFWSKDHPCLFLSGHLGSFELLPSYFAVRGRPLHFMVRPFKQRIFDQIFTHFRRSHGASPIVKTNGVRRLVPLLNNNEMIGLLFDQNITAVHAHFVPWFSLPAATSKTASLLAMKEGVRTWVGFLRRDETESSEKYTFVAKRIDSSDLLDAAKSAPKDEKAKLITNQMSEQMVEFIKSYPEGWFWMHRRWKTRPPGDASRIYD